MKTSSFIRITVCLWLSAMLFFSLEPQTNTTANPYHLDKLVHFSAYFLAGLLSIIAFPHAPKTRLAFLLFSFSFCIEIAQLFTETRSFELADLVANLTGILLAIYLSKFWPAQ